MEGRASTVSPPVVLWGRCFSMPASVHQDSPAWAASHKQVRKSDVVYVPLHHCPLLFISPSVKLS